MTMATVPINIYRVVTKLEYVGTVESIDAAARFFDPADDRPSEYRNRRVRNALEKKGFVKSDTDEKYFVSRIGGKVSPNRFEIRRYSVDNNGQLVEPTDTTLYRINNALFA